MRWLALLFLWPLAALAEGRPFDPGSLGSRDTRFLQAALVWSGDYAGLTDGEWGGRSADALAAWLRRAGADPAAPAAADLRPLLDALAREVGQNGWTVLNLDGGLTVAIPGLLLGEPVDGGDAIEARSADGALVFRVLFDLPPDAADMHLWMEAAHAGPEEPYFSWRDDRLVSAITLGNGKRTYLRSSLVEGVFVSMQVTAEPWERDRLALIASTMQWGAAPDLAPVPGGPLERILLGAPPEPPAVASMEPAPGPTSAASRAPVAAPPAAGMPASGMPASGLLGTGTGFFVNGTDVVTAAHVVAGCRELRLEDGSALTVLATDPALDLAVLASARRSPHWLPLAGVEGPRLGEPVFALGFPYSDLPQMANQGLSVTGGNISALPRVADAASRVMLSAPVQPGNSGGPLLGATGAVLGVVVARIGDGFVMDRTGTIPQNMNYATSVAQLVPFLEAAKVLFPEAGAGAADLSQGIPDPVQAAVVMVGCY